MSQSAELIGVTDAAAILGVSRATVKRMAADGRVPIVAKISGKTGAYVFDPAAVKAVAGKS